MFLIRLIVYLNVIYFIIAQKFHDDDDPIIDPLELVLRSTDSQGIFYCNSRVEINKQQNRLVASINDPILTSPTFQLITEQANSTTIRIRIFPNGYIGVNRISCHWDKNVTYGQTLDLIIGEKPGVIQLKERCRAYDRRYVQCTFRAATIARAFRNRFPRHYQFSELNYDTLSYRQPPTLVNITDENELIFRFEPRDRNVIPKKIPASLNITLVRFGSSVYQFNIEPLHTTNVDFQIKNISTTKFNIYINHNDTGTINRRKCSVHISQADDQNSLKSIQDVLETTDQMISIKSLQPSTKYEVCLRCFYEKTDHSYKEEKCQRATTVPRKLSIGFIVGICVGVVIAFILGILVYRKCAKTRTPPGSHTSSISESKVKKANGSTTVDLSSRMDELQPPDTHIDSDRYTVGPKSTDRLLRDSRSSSIASDRLQDDVLEPPSNDDKYQTMMDFMHGITDTRKVAPDTIDLSNNETV